MVMCSLDCLGQGEYCTILSVDLPQGQKRRLRDLGLAPGASICCGYLAPSGTPIAFWVKGALIALRVEDCRRICICRGEADEN